MGEREGGVLISDGVSNEFGFLESKTQRTKEFLSILVLNIAKMFF